MKDPTSPVRAVILGYGIRGRAYAAYAKTHPEDFAIAGLADPVADFPADAEYPTWKNWEDALDSGAVEAAGGIQVVAFRPGVVVDLQRAPRQDASQSLHHGARERVPCAFGKTHRLHLA